MELKWTKISPAKTSSGIAFLWFLCLPLLSIRAASLYGVVCDLESQLVSHADRTAKGDRAPRHSQVQIVISPVDVGQHLIRARLQPLPAQDNPGRAGS